MTGYLNSTSNAEIYLDGRTFTNYTTKKIGNISWDSTVFMDGKKPQGLVSARELMEMLLEDLEKKLK